MQATERAIAERHPAIFSFLRVHALSLRTSPRWPTLARQLNLPARRYEAHQSTAPLSGIPIAPMSQSEPSATLRRGDAPGAPPDSNPETGFCVELIDDEKSSGAFRPSVRITVPAGGPWMTVIVSVVAIGGGTRA